MLLNCGIGKDSWESLGLQGDQAPVHPKGNQSWMFIGRTDAKAEALILWPPDVKHWLIWKTLMSGKIEGGRRRQQRTVHFQCWEQMSVQQAYWDPDPVGAEEEMHMTGNWDPSLEARKGQRAAGSSSNAVKFNQDAVLVSKGIPVPRFSREKKRKKRYSESLSIYSKDTDITWMKLRKPEGLLSLKSQMINPATQDRSQEQIKFTCREIKLDACISEL